MSVYDPTVAGLSPLGQLPEGLNLKKPEDADGYLTMDNVLAIAKAMGFPEKSITTFAAKAKGKPSAFLKAMPSLDMGRINRLAHEEYMDKPKEFKFTDSLFKDYTNVDKIRFANLLNDRRDNPQVWNYLVGLANRNYDLPTLQKIVGKSRDDNNIDNIVAASQEAGIDAPQVDEVLGSMKLGTTTQQVATNRATGKPPAAGAMRGGEVGTRAGLTGAIAGGYAGIEAGTTPEIEGREPIPGGVGSGGPGGLDTGGLGSYDPAANTPFGEKVPTDPKEVDAYIRRNFGYWSFLLDDPELGPKFRQLAKDKAPSGKIVAEVLNSNWYKTHTTAQQSWAALAGTNPAQANATLQARVGDIINITKKYGLTLDPARLSKMAEDSLKFGWNDQQIMAAVSNEGVFAAGKASPVKNALKATASDYVLTFSDSAIDQWTKQIMSGQATEEEFQMYAQEQAKSMFPSLAAAIDAGRTVKQYADQYVQKAAETLEIDPDQINLTDPKWQKALQYRDAKTGEIMAMTLSEWTDHLKTDPMYNYGKTKQARAEATELATKIGQTFGAV